MRKITFILGILLVGLAFGQSAVRLSPVVQAIRQAAPCLVSIGTEQVVLVNDPYITRLNEYFSLYRYHSRRVKEYIPLGSGVILDSRGLVLTNYHVVKPANRILVRLRHDNEQEPRSYTASIVGFDVPGDLALLKLQGELPKEGFVEANFAVPGDLLLGETVLAMGNPFGLENSVSQGIVSAINRHLGQEEHQQPGGP